MLALCRLVDNIQGKVFEQLLNGKFLWQRMDKSAIIAILVVDQTFA